MDDQYSCHGTFECLNTGSSPRPMSPLFKVRQKLGSYMTWWIENRGWRAMVEHMLVKMFKPHGGTNLRLLSMEKTRQESCQEVLGLQPGELVMVKPVDEIMATLDGNRRHKGLLWMTGMGKYCGKQYRVRGRVERILLETNGELRKMKNTVLLEGVMCDGSAFGRCDRSCFHFWRETWLERVPVRSQEEPCIAASAEEENLS